MTSSIKLDCWSGIKLPHTQVQQIWTIVEESFPPEERDPVQVFLYSIENGKSTLYTASWQKKIIGFTKLTRLTDLSIYLMEYLAVDRHFRNYGVGSALLNFVRQELQAQPNAGIILEVEPPSAAKAAERQLRVHRICFYQRHGAALILDQNAYRMPNLTGEGNVWMHLMWLPVQQGCQPPPDLSLGSLFKLIYSQIYPEEKYHGLLIQALSHLSNPDSPIILEAIP